MSKSKATTESNQRDAETQHPARSLQRLFLYGGVTLGVAVGLERVAGFLSASLAARIAGPQTFGAYSVTLATAGTIAAYAGAGIGSTANRFAGQYPRDSATYAGFLRALTLVALASAGLAGALMLGASVPVARWVIHNDALASAFKLAALTAGAMVLVECFRGLLIGQQKFYSLLLVSLFSGTAILVALPLTARLGARAMIVGQALILLTVAAGFFVFRARLGIAPVDRRRTEQGPGVLPIVKFGIVQFSAFAGIGIATWCIASLVARSDPSLTQMGFYGVSNQLRGLAAIAPGLLAQVVYSLLTNESGEAYGGADRVLFSSAILTTLLVMAAAGLAIVVLPWALLAAYGSSYQPAEVPIVLLLATAVIHMSGQAAAQRLSIVRLRATGAINALWAVVLIIGGVLLIPTNGAAGAAIAFLVAHTVSNALVMLSLYQEKALPSGYLAISVVTAASTFMLAALGYIRATKPLSTVSLTLWIAGIWILGLSVVALIGMKHGFFPQLLLRRNEQPPSVPSLSET